ncbi:LPP20 family lipoprotein [Aliivibrio kagoshimensis]|uniref:LPP20 family lipoprotein n=1 Tax=Aliivibrio kagoshimensis TaxID=2910230 RepID=UPI003D0DC54B
MNLLKSSLIASLGLVLAACGSTTDEVKDEVVTNTPSTPIDANWCKFDDGVSDAPEFFCTGQIDGFVVTGRGSSPKSAAGMNYMVDQATLAARVQLAQNVRTQISSMVKNYLGTTGVTDAESIDKTASSTAESLTDESLMGSRIVRRIVGPQGEVYIWVAIDEENLVAKSQNAIRTSMANDEAAWQQFQGKKSHEEMASKIEELRKQRALTQ